MTRTRYALFGGIIATAVSATIAAGTQSGRSSTPVPREPPRVILLLVVDQFRADYVEQYGQQWSQGLHEVFTRGAVFTEAAVPYAVSRTCTGHATIGTGTFPAMHGIVDNEWFDRSSNRFMSCTEDVSADPVAFGSGRVAEHHGATRLRAPTFADELRKQAKRVPQVIGLGLKARSTVSLIGHGGTRTIAVWEEDSGTWATSTAFAAVPSREVTTYVAKHPTTAARGSMWNRLLPPAVYLYDDRAPGEPSDVAFPHVLAPPLGVSFVPVWDASPSSDAYLGDLAVGLIESLKIGQEPGTDFVAVSFAALDYVGHRYGPRSHEVQDVLARLDVTVGKLISALDKSVGRERYVLVLTSDHGVAPLPEQSAALGTPGGRVSLSAIGRAVDMAASVALGSRASVVSAISGTSIYFQPGTTDKIRSTSGAQGLIERALTSVPGVARVFWADDLVSTRATEDEQLVLMRRSFVADRSGDVMFVPRPHWVLAEAGTNHGTPYDYDLRVPLAFLGAGLAPGRHTAPASLVDIAPTLALLTGVKMTRTDGRVLGEVAKR